MSFYNNFLERCADIKKAPSAVAEECGLTRSAVTGWKRGSVPYAGALQRIADYFSCTPEDLLTGEKEKAAPTREDSPVWKTAVLALQDMTDDELIRVIADAQKIKESRKGSE